MINIYLFNTSRNLNRCIRLLHSFGYKKLHLISCKKTIEDGLYSATNQIEILDNSSFPNPEKTLVFEVNGKESIHNIDFSRYENIIIGGESVTLNKTMGTTVNIPTKNTLSIVLF